MFFFVFNLIVFIYRSYRRKRRRPNISIEIDSSIDLTCVSRLQTDQVGELRTPLNNSMSIETPGVLANSPFSRFRGSIAWTEGFEQNLHILAKDQYPERALGVFTSGGDAQGIQIISSFLISSYFVFSFRNESSCSCYRSNGYLSWLQSLFHPRSTLINDKK